MPKYRVLSGIHVTQEGKQCKKGKVFRSSADNLHKVFKNKLELVKGQDIDDLKSFKKKLKKKKKEKQEEVKESKKKQKTKK